MSQKKSITGGLLRIAFSFVVFLVLLEPLLRFFWMLPLTAKGAYFRRDDFADHSHYPYGMGRMVTKEFDVVLRMNNIGMRDDDVEIPKPPGRKRVLVIGDSFMEGWGIERPGIFTDILEAELKKAMPRSEVVAAGVASWSTLAEFAWLKQEGLKLEPDLVIFALDATDPAGDSFYARRLVRDEKGRPDHIRRSERWLDLPKFVHDFLARWSYTYRYLDRFLIKSLRKSEWDHGYWNDDVWIPARSVDEIGDEKYEEYWAHTREAFGAARDLLAERGIPWLVFQYPTGAETDTSAWVPGRTTARFPEGVTAARRFDYFASFARSDSIPYLSLLEAFRGHDSPAELFMPYDGHWSALGHRFAASVVEREILMRGLLADD